MLKSPNNKAHIIFHIDFNAYFCSVAEIFNPALRDTAFAIGRENSLYGVISTCSYEARKYGIRSGMSQTEALKLYPKLNIVSLPYENYVNYHKKFLSLLHEYTDLIEVASIDEAYIDVTKVCDKVHPLLLAKEIQTKLLERYHLKVSIGIAPTLFLAKMASDMKKPLGITVLRIRDIKEKLYPLSVKDIFGIGKKTAPRLENIGINNICDFVNENNKAKIVNLIGLKHYNHVIESLSGKSRNYIDNEKTSVNESISVSETYDRRLTQEEDILSELEKLTRNLYKRLTRQDKYVKTISITLRDTNFKTITRSKTIEYTNDYIIIKNVVDDLFYDNYDYKTYRLLGVTFANLISKELLPKPYDLFNIDNKKTIIDEMVLSLNEKFGSYAVYFASASKKSLTSNTTSKGVEAPEVMTTLFTEVKS